mgnify:CR=1 FL=1
MNELVFSKIKLENIFDDSYIDFVENNKIIFVNFFAKNKKM